MTAARKQIVFLILFFAVLSSTFVLRRSLSGTIAMDPINRRDALERYGFFREEVSKKCGIDFTHQAPTLDARLNHIMPIIASMGASVTVVDFDRDGWPDLYVVNSG